MKSKLLGVAFAVTAMALLFSAPASAIPITWNLQNVTFNDGNTATGSYVYDADINQYSSINITTSAGNSSPKADVIRKPG